MHIHLKTLGCRLNEAELESWSRDFLARGHQITHELEAADLVVVNTCAVTQEAVRKSRKLIRRAQRTNPVARLVVSGCYSSLERADTPGVDLMVNNRDKDRLVEIVERQLNLLAMPELATEPGENALLTRGRQRAFVKVQDGCRYRCTFCIVTVARGGERSRPIPEIIAEINRLHAGGVQEAVLTGVHIGGYGSDRGTTLTHLLRTLLAETEIPRIRLGSLEPWDIPEDFWSLFENPRFMPHLHLPLQSGADAVLRRMARRSTTADFAHLVAQAREAIPNFNVTTDIMVGFPGETVDEWRQTIDFVEQTGFGHLHIFTYSPRPGTRAADLPDQVDTDTKRARSRELHRLGKRLKRAHLEASIGQERLVLIEGKTDNGAGNRETWGGYTPNFLRVTINAPAGAQLENRIQNLRLEAVADSGEAVTANLI